MARFAVVVMACLLAVATVEARTVTKLSSATVETYFSPNGGATEAIVALIKTAKRRVALAAYGFTSQPIADALLAAHSRGIDVRVVVDKSNVSSKYSRADTLMRAGIDVRSHHGYAIMHHKFLLVDDVTALGSMNATESGELRNAENWNVFRNARALTRVYEQEFDRLSDGARVFVRARI